MNKITTTNDDSPVKYIIPYNPQNEKLQFCENISKWMQIDSQIQIHNENIKKLRESKTQLSTNIIEYMKSKNIAHSKVSFKTGELCLQTKRDYAPLTFTYIENCLAKVIDNPSDIEFIIQMMKTNRTIKESQSVKITHYNDT